MDPATMKLAGDFLGGAAQGLTGGSAGPSQAGADFDASGWNVTYGTGNIESSRSQPTPASPANFLPYALAAVALLIVWKISRR